MASTGLDRQVRARGRRCWWRRPGSTPSAVSVPASAFTTSLIVPSPEKTTTRSIPSWTACAASSFACPRSLVSVTSSRKSADSAFSMTASVGLETVRATGFTISRTRWNRMGVAAEYGRGGENPLSADQGKRGRLGLKGRRERPHVLGERLGHLPGREVSAGSHLGEPDDVHLALGPCRAARERRAACARRRRAPRCARALAHRGCRTPRARSRGSCASPSRWCRSPSRSWRW